MLSSDWGIEEKLQSIFENHIFSHILVLWKDGLFTLSLLPARPVSRSSKVVTEVSNPFRLAIEWLSWFFSLRPLR